MRGFFGSWPLIRHTSWTNVMRWNGLTNSINILQRNVQGSWTDSQIGMWKWGRVSFSDHLVCPWWNSHQLFVSPCHMLYNKLQSKESKQEKMRDRGIEVQQGKYSHPLWCALRSGIFHSSCLQPGFTPSANTIEEKFDKHCRPMQKCKSVYIMPISFYEHDNGDFYLFSWLTTKTHRIAEFIQQ